MDYLAGYLIYLVKIYIFVSIDIQSRLNNSLVENKEEHGVENQFQHYEKCCNPKDELQHLDKLVLTVVSLFPLPLLLKQVLSEVT